MFAAYVLGTVTAGYPLIMGVCYAAGYDVTAQTGAARYLTLGEV